MAGGYEGVCQPANKETYNCSLYSRSLIVTNILRRALIDLGYLCVACRGKQVQCGALWVHLEGTDQYDHYY